MSVNPRYHWAFSRRGHGTTPQSTTTAGHCRPFPTRREHRMDLNRVGWGERTRIPTDWPRTSKLWMGRVPKGSEVRACLQDQKTHAGTRASMFRGSSMLRDDVSISRTHYHMQSGRLYGVRSPRKDRETTQGIGRWLDDSILQPPTRTSIPETLIIRRPNDHTAVPRQIATALQSSTGCSGVPTFPGKGVCCCYFRAGDCSVPQWMSPPPGLSLAIEWSPWVRTGDGHEAMYLLLGPTK